MVLAKKKAEPLPEPTPAVLDAAFEALYATELAWVYRTLRRLGGRPADLEDLTHDVFVAAYRALARFDPSRPVRPWLFGIAFRVVSDYRSRARFFRESSLGELEPASDPDTSPESALADAESRALVLRALDTLPLDQRAVFVASEIDETSIADLAEHLGLSVNTLYSRLRLARARFAAAVKALTEDGGRR